GVEPLLRVLRRVARGGRSHHARTAVPGLRMRAALLPRRGARRHARGGGRRPRARPRRRRGVDGRLHRPRLRGPALGHRHDGPPLRGAHDAARLRGRALRRGPEARSGPPRRVALPRAGLLHGRRLGRAPVRPGAGARRAGCRLHARRRRVRPAARRRRAVRRGDAAPGPARGPARLLRRRGRRPRPRRPRRRHPRLPRRRRGADHHLLPRPDRPRARRHGGGRFAPLGRPAHRPPAGGRRARERDRRRPPRCGARRERARRLRPRRRGLGGCRLVRRHRGDTRGAPPSRAAGGVAPHDLAMGRRPCRAAVRGGGDAADRRPGADVAPVRDGGLGARVLRRPLARGAGGRLRAPGPPAARPRPRRPPRARPARGLAAAQRGARGPDGPGDHHDPDPRGAPDRRAVARGAPPRRACVELGPLPRVAGRRARALGDRRRLAGRAALDASDDHGLRAGGVPWRPPGLPAHAVGPGPRHRRRRAAAARDRPARGRAPRPDPAPRRPARGRGAERPRLPREARAGDPRLADRDVQPPLPLRGPRDRGRPRRALRLLRLAGRLRRRRLQVDQRHARPRRRRRRPSPHRRDLRPSAARRGLCRAHRRRGVRDPAPRDRAARGAHGRRPAAHRRRARRHPRGPPRDPLGRRLGLPRRRHHARGPAPPRRRGPLLGQAQRQGHLRAGLRRHGRRRRRGLGPRGPARRPPLRPRGLDRRPDALHPRSLRERRRLRDGARRRARPEPRADGRAAPRGAAARHRQGRGAGRDPLQAGPAHGLRAGGDRAPLERRGHDDPALGAHDGGEVRPPPPRALRRRGLPRPDRRRGDPLRVAHPLRRRLLRGDDLRPRLPQGHGARRGAGRAAALLGHAVRPAGRRGDGRADRARRALARRAAHL
ncbi:MAG: diguanylate cyclase/phosphodiesterase (GGDEF & EAL domains) with PAS/PAC sensor(s), partial [uncultured Solirubrobacteraceae bacterium]